MLFKRFMLLLTLAQLLFSCLDESDGFKWVEERLACRVKCVFFKRVG